MAGVADWTLAVKGEEDNREYNIAAMVILALETVTRAGSAAIFSGDGLVAAMLGDATRTHGVRLPNELRMFVETQGLSLAGIDYFVAVTGPGSFTGLRIGLATIQGLSLASGRPVIGIPTMEAMASGFLDEHPGRYATLATVLDAARGEVFYAVWDVTGARAIEDARPLIESRVGTASAASAELVAAGGLAPIALIGPGAERDAPTFIALRPDARLELRMPNLAAAAARLAARRLSSATAPHGLRPVYVRRPDAELARDRARAAPQPAVITSPDPAAGPDAEIVVSEVTTPDDVRAVAALQERSFGRGWGAEAWRQELANVAVARLYAARRRSGEVVAYCGCWQVVDELHINSLAVDPAQRRQGIARALLRHVMRAAAAAGATGATLEVRESNQAGRALYEGLGFIVEAVRRDYYDHPKEDALVLWHRSLRLW